jgi:hypothetical protein
MASAPLYDRQPQRDITPYYRSDISLYASGLPAKFWESILPRVASCDVRNTGSYLRSQLPKKYGLLRKALQATNVVDLTRYLKDVT